MNIQTEIRPELWQAILKPYQAGHYTNAVLDAIHYLTDIIRDKADVDGDGVKMIGPAFGGTNPRIRINKLQTQSERDAQIGLHKTLEGIYYGIRNPRSHEQIEDTQDTADAILIIVNYALNIIVSSRGPFVLEDWIERVFDPDFHASERYSEILVGEVPKKRHVDTFMALYRRKMECVGENLRFIFGRLLAKMSEDDVEDIITFISDDLRRERSEAAISRFIDSFPSHMWPNIAEDARLRIENKLLKSIKKGTLQVEKYPDQDDNIITSYEMKGIFGTYIIPILDYIIHKQELYETILAKLSGRAFERVYILDCFLVYLPRIVANAPDVGEHIEKHVAKHLCAKAEYYPEEYRDKLMGVSSFLPDEWAEAVAIQVLRTKSLHDDVDVEDLPF